jgi:hypothetical protein
VELFEALELLMTLLPTAVLVEDIVLVDVLAEEAMVAEDEVRTEGWLSSTVVDAQCVNVLLLCVM